MVMPMWCFVQLKWTWCDTPSHIKPAFLFFAFFQLQCILKYCSSDHASVVPCHLQIFASSNQPLAYCHMQGGWVLFLFCIFLVSNSSTLLHLRNQSFTFTL